LNVGAANFWLDPTHLRPVHPAYLSFLFSDVGYVGVETRYLHPHDDYRASQDGEGSLQEELMRALRGAQDYAVLGVKPGPELSDQK
jgi:O-antigen chain-terminating methyltransferase